MLGSTRESVIASAMRPPRRLGALTLGRFMRHRMAVAAALLLAILVLFALAAPIAEALLGIDAESVDLLARMLPPSSDHPLGTDELGRDLLARLMYGGRISLIVGLTTALAAALIGTAIGVTAGYFGGWPDSLLMRLTDSVIALPLLPLLIVMAAIDLGKLGLPADLATAPETSLYRIIAIIALVGWTTVARLVRGATLSLRTREFVLSAAAVGAGPMRIMLVHILPNAISPIVVATTLSIGEIILLESVLSFLGLGIQPPMASWGNMLTNAQDIIFETPWLAVYPGLLIFLTVIAFNFLGDGLQDALDPKAAWA